MKYFVYLYALSLLCFWKNFVRAAVSHTTTTSDDNFLLKESLLCDNTHIETKLETLELRIEMMEDQLNNLFSSLDKKINDLPRKFEIMHEKLLKENKFYFEELKASLNEQIQNQVRTFVQPPVDDKIFILSDIKEMLKDYDKALDNIVSNQKQSEKLLKDANCERHTTTLANTMSNKLAILHKLDGKLATVESSGSKTETEQLKFRCDLQKYLDRKEVLKGTCKDDYNNLFCTQPYPTSCADLSASHCVDDKCCISNHLYGPESFLVSCNNKDQGGGWTVIQRRINGSVDFYRDWSEYKNGFGDVNGEFFIGLDKLHALTTTLKPTELLIQLEDFNNTTKYAKYDDFQVGNETEYYKLIKVGSYSGDAGDSFSYHQGYNFTTKDRDNDVDKSVNCAVDKTGAWWYEKCMWSNLNGKYYANGQPLNGKRGICWNDFHGYTYSLKFVQMMIRPKKL